ncbi:hypothetical protein [Absidia glauca]|uniref:CAP-Gly domain-containing protein n=1 Tax=Absidia glauca TaxID=4829 RepID=A0A168N4V6_ABSGL|nr:hypothetical protein [Absidia glauca]
MLKNNPGRIGRLSSGVPCTFEKGPRPASAITTIKQHKPSTPATKNRPQRSCQPSSISTAVSAKNDSSFDSTGLTVGQKVSVSSLCALGTIRYIGAIGIKPGLWIGLELDITGSGKNDGSIKGARYFNCPPETGLFILANKVTPLQKSASLSPSFAVAAGTPSVVASKKSITTNGRRHGTKVPSENDTTTNRTTHRSPVSSRQQKQTAQQPVTPTPPLVRTKSVTNPSSPPLSSKASRRHSPPVPKALSTTQKPLAASRFSKSPVAATRPSSVSRRTATPIIATPTKSSPYPKQQGSKISRQTVTPTTTTRQRSSNSSTARVPETLRRSKSTSTRQTVTPEELAKMHQLLEQSRQEKQRLSDEMDGKEAIWERLVTAKESYALQVQDMQLEITRLQDALNLAQQQQQQQQQQAQSPQVSPHSTLELQYTRRIEKLEGLVQQWQRDAQVSHQQLQQQQRDHAAQMEQLRQNLTERDQATADMERNYEATQKASTEACVRHYESTLAQWTSERDQLLASKDDEIARLTQLIDTLKPTNASPTENNDDDDDTGASMFHTSSHRRLEQQLELTTQALENLQRQHQATLHDIEQLRHQVAHQHTEAQAAEQRIRQLLNDLAQEINNRRLVMEERDAGLQNQQRIEDERKDLANTNTRLEDECRRLKVDLEQVRLGNKPPALKLEDKDVLHSDMPISPISDAPAALYCEICETHGHDVMACKAVHSLSLGEQVYCFNCDVFDEHTTWECPNQDESY